MPGLPITSFHFPVALLPSLLNESEFSVNQNAMQTPSLRNIP